MTSLISEMQKQAVERTIKQKEEIVLNAAMVVFDDIKCLDDLLAHGSAHTDQHGCGHYYYKGNKFLFIDKPSYQFNGNEFSTLLEYKIIK